MSSILSSTKSFVTRVPLAIKAALENGAENAHWFWARLRSHPVDKISYWPPFIRTDHWVAFALIVLAVFFLADPLARSLTTSLPLASLHLFGVITKFGGSSWYIVPTGATLLVLTIFDWDDVSRKVKPTLLTVMWQVCAILIAFAGSGIAVNLIKRMIGRARPKHFEEMGSFAFDPFAFSSSFASFPSGHATTMGCLIVLVLIFVRKWRFALITLAGLIALSRVVIGSHYPSDILAGLAFGGLSTWFVIIYFAKRGLGFRFDAECGSIVPRQIRIEPKGDILVRDFLMALTSPFRK